MKCPSCQSENPDGMKFCGECGARLERVCPKCNSSNPFQFKFCGECGHNLSVPFEPLPRELTFEEKLAKVQRYLPKGVIEKVLSQRDKIEGERKQVTVMFADMEGFTSLSEKLGPEEAYAIMDQVYEILIHQVHRYEGTVNEMTGDGIMALFGAPIALEDAPQRAIRSAYAIHREMTKLSDRLRQEKAIPPIKMRVGIHTGPVVVGTLGNDLRVEFKAVGDTVNLASRMEGLGEPGSIYVTEDTFRLTEGLFRFEALGEKEVKGREKPVRIYRVIAPSTRRTRFDVSAERGLTPFVGRERELELLLDGFERAKEGRGQAVSVMAEAGVGKSRFLYEFRKAVTNEDVTFLEAKCLSYSRGVSYHPVIDILKSTFDIREEDGDFEIREKVSSGLKVLSADEASTLPYLLELLSVKDSGIDQIAMSLEARKDCIIEALRRIVLKGSEIRPLIMAFEDLHWIDKSSEDSLKDLLNTISGARVFVIFTYRPEFVHTWGGKSYHSQITLNRLSNKESLSMVSHLLGTDEIESGLEEFIFEKTEGIPFFIEEFIKSLKDLRIIEKKDNIYRIAKDIQTMMIPSSIQDVVMARVDSLHEGVKETLQKASVIEKEFSYELIKRIMTIPEKELLSHLSALKDSELLYERGIHPRSTYIFKHSLTREVLYDSILADRKKTLHEEIGNVIEEIYEVSIDEHYGILAEHFIAGQKYEKGAEYSKLTAKKAEKKGSLNDAIVYAKKRVFCTERLPQTDEMQRKLIDSRTVLGMYMLQMDYILQAKEAVDPVFELALKLKHKRRLSQIYTVIGTYNYYVKEDLSEAKRSYERALTISEEVKDIISLVLANVSLGSALSLNCEFEKGSFYIEKALDISAAANSLWGIARMKSILSAACYFYQGDLNLSYQASDDARRIAEETADINAKAMAYTSLGMSCYGKGFLENAKDYLLRGVEYCERINLFSWSAIAHFFLGETYLEIPEYKKAEDHHFKAIVDLQRGGYWLSLSNLNRMGLVRAKVMSDEKDIDIESSYRYMKHNLFKVWDGWIQRCMSEILLHIDNEDIFEAEKWICSAIRTDDRNGVMFYLGQDFALYAELLKQKGDQPKARENLGKAIEILKECGADGWVEKYEKELAAVS